MSAGLSGRLHNGNKDDKHRIIKYLPAIVLLLLGSLLFLSDFLGARKGFDGLLERNAAGQGSRTESLRVQVEDEEKIHVELPVSEQMYQEIQVNEMFDRVEDRLDQMILGENESLDHVDHDLKLLTSLSGEPVKIEWQLSDYSVMLSSGELIREELKDKADGIAEELTATITYTEDERWKEVYSFFAMLYPRRLTKEEAYQEAIFQYLKSFEEKERENSTLKLPGLFNGKALSYYRDMDVRGIVLIVMAPLVAILLKALEKQKKEEARRLRRKQLIRDYPELLMKLTIFIGAGMTAKRAWRQMVNDYVQQKHLTGERFAYEEMVLTANEMESGITEANSYLNFGRRCDTQEYIRFSAILSQNLRKGTRGLTEVLRTESIQAFEDRKALARRLGEEAGTKLLIPMVLMLGIVLVIVMVPAMMSIQI